MIRASAHGRAFTSREEGGHCKLGLGGLYYPYRDQIGKWTIATGHLCRPGEYDKFAKGLTGAECDALFEADLLPCDLALEQHAPKDRTQNQHDAWVCFLINEGVGAADPKRNTAMKMWVADADPLDIEPFFLAYDMAGGEHTTYLRNRRKREWRLFNTPDGEPFVLSDEDRREFTARGIVLLDELHDDFAGFQSRPAPF